MLITVSRTDSSLPLRRASRSLRSCNTPDGLPAATGAKHSLPTLKTEHNTCTHKHGVRQTLKSRDQMRSLSCCGHLVQMALLHSLFFLFCFTYSLEIKVLLALYHPTVSKWERHDSNTKFFFLSMLEFILNVLKFSSFKWQYSQPELASYLQDLPSAHRLYRPWM